MSLWKALNALFQKDIKKLSDKALYEKYIAAGTKFGKAVGLLHVAECVGFHDMLDDWAKHEREWARRGYRTFPCTSFVEFSDSSSTPTSFPAQRREDEDVVLHAENYRDHYDRYERIV